MIVLFTDFGLEGPYVGQLKAVLWRAALGIPVIDLFSNAPAHDPQAAAYLLAAYVEEFPRPTVFLCVVDPGVGSASRAPVAVEVDGRWFVGPDNGLFNMVVLRGKKVRWWDITWRPQRLSATFHGRDLFAPVAARLARGELPPGELQDAGKRVCRDWPAEYLKIIYIDHFGNAMTGIRACSLAGDETIEANGRFLHRALTYDAVERGQCFWYENANGLVEIAMNRGRVDLALGLKVGNDVTLSRPDPGL